MCSFRVRASSPPSGATQMAVLNPRPSPSSSPGVSYSEAWTWAPVSAARAAANSYVGPPGSGSGLTPAVDGPPVHGYDGPARVARSDELEHPIVGRVPADADDHNIIGDVEVEVWHWAFASPGERHRQHRYLDHLEPPAPRVTGAFEAAAVD